MKLIAIFILTLAGFAVAEAPRLCIHCDPLPSGYGSVDQSLPFDDSFVIRQMKSIMTCLTVQIEWYP